MASEHSMLARHQASPASDKWIPDQNAVACNQCHDSFNMIRRRHHCRLCGGIFCGSCTKNELYVIPDYVRVCDGCYKRQKDLVHQKALEATEREKQHFKELAEEEAKQRAKAKAKKGSEGGAKEEKKADGSRSKPEESAPKHEALTAVTSVTPPSNPSSSSAPPHRPAPTLPPPLQAAPALTPAPPVFVLPPVHASGSSAPPHRSAPTLPPLEPACAPGAVTVFPPSSTSASSSSSSPPSHLLPTAASSSSSSSAPPHRIPPPLPADAGGSQPIIKPAAPASSSTSTAARTKSPSPMVAAERPSDVSVAPATFLSPLPPSGMKPKAAPKTAAIATHSLDTDAGQSTSPTPSPAMVPSSSAGRMKPPPGAFVLPQGLLAPKPPTQKPASFRIAPPIDVSAALKSKRAPSPLPTTSEPLAPPVPSRNNRQPSPLSPQAASSSSPRPSNGPALTPSSSHSGSHEGVTPPPIPSRSSRPGIISPPPRPPKS